MDRREELIKIIPAESLQLVTDVIDEVVFLEEKLTELRKLPFIETHPQNPMRQRNTPAAKMYKDFLQQYNNCIKLIESIIYRDKKLDKSEAEESPLRKWFNNRAKDSTNPPKTN